MTGQRMHADEVDVEPDLVRRLLERQFPHLAGLPLRRVPSAGTDNAIFRVGDRLAARLPRYPNAARQVEKEQRWVPVVAPYLPLAVPVPVGAGEPGEGYPFPWSVVPWLDGENATLDRFPDPRVLAADVGALVAAFRAIDVPGGPAPGRHNFSRGVPLATRDERTRECIAESAAEVDAAAVTAAWDAALRVPPWAGPPCWLHGDLQSGNLLARDGRLTGVIDFGGLGVGDPACDLIVAWNLLPAGARDVFRDAAGADEATWARGRGWALSIALLALPYYLTTNPAIVASSRHVIAEVLADEAR
jgi:aminoglycoside phosphotransferase (APT) family kinase protein